MFSASQKKLGLKITGNHIFFCFIQWWVYLLIIIALIVVVIVLVVIGKSALIRVTSWVTFNLFAHCSFGACHKEVELLTSIFVF